MPVTVFNIPTGNGNGAGQIIGAAVIDIAITVNGQVIVHGIVQIGILPGIDSYTDGGRNTTIAQSPTRRADAGTDGLQYKYESVGSIIVAAAEVHIKGINE